MAADGDDHAGRTFGNYRLVREIGHGGMGIVYEAVHDAIGRRAAIKVLRAQLADDPEAIERFFREARAVNQVRHPSLVQIFDMGRTDDGVVYSIMELLEGESLAARLRREGPMAPIDAMRCFGECADALAAVHAHGIAHRDLKPDNIFLAREPGIEGEHAVLLDFGVAKLMDHGPGIRTLSGGGAIVGTPMYMSPEQVEGRHDVDTRADVYSMGCVLYDMLTGAPPFLASSIAELLLMHTRMQAPLLRSRRPELPPALDDAVQIAMAKDPSQRFDSIVAFATALRSAAGPFGVAMPLVRVRAATAPGEAVTAAPVRPLDGSASGNGNGGRARRRPAMTTGAGAAAEMVARESAPTRVPTSRAEASGRTTRWLVAGASLAAIAIATPLAWHFVDGGSGKRRFAAPVVADAGTVVLREDRPSKNDATVTPVPDVPNVPVPDVPDVPTPVAAAANESDCRAALAHVAPLFTSAVPDAARAWRRFADPARRDALVAACVAQFDAVAATCFQAATDALAVGRCGDALLQRRCERGVAEACGDASQVALAAGHFDTAFHLGEAACRAGIGRGCATLGNAFTYGRGTSVDLAQARAAYERGAAVDDPESQAGLAHLLRYGLGGGFDPLRARQLFTAACHEDASHWACAGLAELELAGLGGRQTRSSARAHLEPACRADEPEACMRLAGLSHGAEKQRLLGRAREVFELEAERKPLAALRLGELTRDGKGGRADAPAARVLFARACDAHEPLACEALADLLRSGSVGEPDLAGARAAYERACSSGLPRSCEAFHCEQRLDPSAHLTASTPSLVDCKRRGYLGPVRRERLRIVYPAPMDY